MKDKAKAVYAWFQNNTNEWGALYIGLLIYVIWVNHAGSPSRAFQVGGMAMIAILAIGLGFMIRESKRTLKFDERSVAHSIVCSLIGLFTVSAVAAVIIWVSDLFS